ncbi:hypothetical protein EniLVp02_0008 [Vibrio phage EniLVp02]
MYDLKVNGHPPIQLVPGFDVASSENVYQALKFIPGTHCYKMILYRHIRGIKKQVREFEALYPDERSLGDRSLRLSNMRTALECKFDPVARPELCQMLVNTFPYTLIEGNNWGDTFWGVCDGKGLNYLGILLMNTRKNLMMEHGYEPT